MVIDVVDYTRNGGIDPHRHWSHTDLAESNRRPVIVLLMPTDTLGSIVTRILNASRAKGEAELLRFHGHGSPGSFLHGTLTMETIRRRRPLVETLRRCFAPSGQAFLMGCEIGQALGYLMELAECWQVPVTAGIGTQYSIGRATFSFEGRTATALPNRTVEFDRTGIPRLTDL